MFSLSNASHRQTLLRFLRSRLLQLLVCLTLLPLAGCGSDSSGVVDQHVTPSLTVTLDNVQTCPGLGAAQGAAYYQGKVYLYGDANPGVIREYQPVDTPNGFRLDYTGLEIKLTRASVNLIKHPTGLAFHPTLGVFLGNTVNRKGTIFRLDWAAMLRDRTLDHAVLSEITDDAAVNGSRPELVNYQGQLLIATSDYGNRDNRLRLYEPEALARATKTSDAGVLAASWPCGPWVQSLCWLPGKQTLVLVQNRIEGRLWRLTAVQLTNPDADLRTVPSFDSLDIPDELEGFTVIDDSRCVMVSSSSTDNTRTGRWQLIGSEYAK
jgi:hypothetical protein